MQIQATDTIPRNTATDSAHQPATPSRKLTGRLQAHTVQLAEETPLPEPPDQSNHQGMIHPRFLVQAPKRITAVKPPEDGNNDHFDKILLATIATLIVINVLAYVVESYYFYQEHGRLPEFHETLAARLG